MSESSNAEQALCYVDAILYHFIEDNLPASFKLKALAVMSTAFLHSGGYNRQSGLTIGQIAKHISISDTALLRTVGILEETNMIHREQAQGRGNRLIITPLSPDQWRLPDGKRISGLEEGQQHLDGQSRIPYEQRMLYDNIAPFGALQPLWVPLFEKLDVSLEGDPNVTSYEPSKLRAVLLVIADYSERPGSPCRLQAQGIGKILHTDKRSMGRALARLEAIGLISRQKLGTSKIITPILPE